MKKLDCGGGQVVSVIAFYSDDPGSTPAVLSVKFVFEKNENKQKEAGVGPFLKKKILFHCFDVSGTIPLRTPRVPFPVCTTSGVSTSCAKTPRSPCRPRC